MESVKHDYAPLAVTPINAAAPMPAGPMAEEIPLQPASEDIWDKKYRLKTKDGDAVDADIDATLRRVAASLADVEATPALREYWNERFLHALRHGAIPAGRIGRKTAE